MTMPIKFKRWLKGLLKSWQINIGHICAGLAFVEAQHGLLSRWLGEDSTATVLGLSALTLYLLRAKTSESLESKGAK